jgi:hypothetical protein
MRLRAPACLLLTLFFALALSAPALAADHRPIPPSAPALSADFGLQSELYREEIHERIRQLTAYEQALLELGRPPNYRLKRGLSITATSLGAAMVPFGLFVGAFASAVENGARPYLAVAGIGAALLVVGVTGIMVLRRHPYRQEVKHVRAERAYWSGELKRLRELQFGELSSAGALELVLGPGGAALRARY